jgi:glycosyltransferase involved in cell wall biosynthesis
MPKVGFDQLPRDTLKILKKKSTKKGKVVFFQDVVLQGTNENYKLLGTTTTPNEIRIAYSMFESTRIPAEWVVIFNTYFDAIAVPDKFLISVYKNSGVQIPIFELPLALDLDNFMKEPLKTSKHSPLTFANFSACVDRKNHLNLIRGFAKAFGNSKDVLLKINFRFGEENLVRQLAKEITALGLENVQFSRLCLESDAYLKNFKSIDCYVNLAKGEGFSIQPREAMVLGIPVILTNNTAQTTICESGLVYAVNSAIPEPARYPPPYDPSIELYGNNFNCAVDEVANALKEVYDNYPGYLAKGAEARQWAKQYEYAHLKPLYLTLVQPKKIVMGSENKVTADSLTTNSPELYEKYTRLFTKLNTH